MPSRVRNPGTPAAGALRGSPASSTSTERLDLPSISAPLRPAAPPPTTTTSYVTRSCPAFVPMPVLPLGPLGRFSDTQLVSKARSAVERVDIWDLWDNLR